MTRVSDTGKTGDGAIPPEDPQRRSAHPEEGGRERTVIAPFKPPLRPDPGADEADQTITAQPGGAVGTGTGNTTGTETTSNAESRRAKIEIGTIINGNYHVVEELKSGGMGRVYRGVTIGNDLPVAIKTVRAELADDDKYGELFRSESKVLGTLRDEAIVNYNNFQYDAELRRWFLVMEFIPGESLRDYVRRNGGITIVQAARLFRRVAMGLAKAHEAGVIHRDLSPDNVMLRNGDLQQAVLIDFGIAKSLVGENRDNRSSFAGKLKYAAPEQLGLFDGEVGPQTDVYGLGLLMAAALSGRPLPMGTSLESAVEARRQVPDLSTVPLPFRPLLLQMLQPNPSARPNGMAGVIANLPAPDNKTASGLSSVETGSQAIGHVPGLRRPPSVTQPMGTTAPGTLSGAEQDGTDTTSAEAGSGAITKRKSRAPAILLGALGLAAIAGAAAFLISPTDNAPAEQTGATAAAAPPEDAFLAGLDTGPCTLATWPRAGEPFAGTIVAYGAAPTAGGPLSDAFAQEFSTPPPQVIEQIVSPMQCAVLDSARRLQAGTLVPIRLALEPVRDNTMRGEILDGEDRRLWLAAVNRNGQVTPLNSFRSEKDGESSPFSVPLNPASRNFPFIVVALATPVPLIETAIISSGAEADALFAKIMQEIDEKGIAETSALRILRLDAP